MGSKALSILIFVLVAAAFGYRFRLLGNEVSSLESQKRWSFKFPSVRAIRPAEVSVDAVSKPSVWGVEGTSAKPVQTNILGVACALRRENGSYRIEGGGGTSWTFYGTVNSPVRGAVFTASGSRVVLVREGGSLCRGMKLRKVGSGYVLLDDHGKSVKLTILEGERR